MQAAESYVNERLDHLGIVAGVCQEISLTAWLDEQGSTHRQQVSVGTATTAMILNGLGFSNRQLYLVPYHCRLCSHGIIKHAGLIAPLHLHSLAK